jgi:hypothetical protein
VPAELVPLEIVPRDFAMASAEAVEFQVQAEFDFAVGFDFVVEVD